MLITYTDYLCVVFVCVCPGEGNVALNATPNPFHLNKICLNQQRKEKKHNTKTQKIKERNSIVKGSKM